VAELTPIPSAQRPADPGYQPVSGYAVAAAIVAGLFAVMLAVVVLSAVATRRSPLSYELLILPAVGWVLAIVARAHVRNSEGTRTGFRLTNAAWWVCVLGGAGFLAFLKANDVVLQKQSQREATKFVEALRADKPQEAFLMTLPKEERTRARADDAPEDFEKAYGPAYESFLQQDVVRLVRRNGSAAAIDHTATKDVGTEAGGFKATHVYHMTCPEGTFDLNVKLVAAETKSGEQPVWRIPAFPAPNFTLTSPQLSQYGRLRLELEQEADAFAKNWMLHLTNARPAESHLMTLPKAERERGEAAVQAVPFFAGAAALTFPVPPDFLPENRGRAEPKAPFDLLAEAGFFRRDEQGSPLPADRLAKLRALWASPTLVPGGTSRRNQLGPAPAEPPTMTVSPSAVTVGVAAEFVPPNSRDYFPATIGVVSTEPALLAVLEDARKRGPDAKDDGSLTLRTAPPRDWRIGWLRTTLEPVAPPAPLTPAGPGGARPGGGM
jgi:hypothetical protein